VLKTHPPCYTVNTQTSTPPLPNQLPTTSGRGKSTCFWKSPGHTPGRFKAQTLCVGTPWKRASICYNVQNLTNMTVRARCTHCHVLFGQHMTTTRDSGREHDCGGQVISLLCSSWLSWHGYTTLYKFRPISRTRMWITVWESGTAGGKIIVCTKKWPANARIRTRAPHEE
jgi:hypothetical protein